MLPVCGKPEIVSLSESVIAVVEAPIVLPSVEVPAAAVSTMTSNFSGVPLLIVKPMVVNVTVPEPARNPSDATAYKCGLHLSGVNDLNVSATVPSNRFSYMDDSFTRFPLAPGAPLRKTTGEIALPR